MWHLTKACKHLPHHFSYEETAAQREEVACSRALIDSVSDLGQEQNLGHLDTHCAAPTPRSSAWVHRGDSKVQWIGH